MKNGLAWTSIMLGLVGSVALASAAQATGTPLVPIAEAVIFPFYGRGTATEAVLVPAFEIERTPVTNAQFLAFVRSAPRWQRGTTPLLFADESYLAHWAGPLDHGYSIVLPMLLID